MLTIDIDIAEETEGSVIAALVCEQSYLNATTQSICEILNLTKPAYCTVRLVEATESQMLNAQYRGKDKPTNVLSFPADIPQYIDDQLIGDIALCVPIVVAEAEEQGKSIKSHLSHILIHGVLHLLGYDHITEEQAEEMETLEKEILDKLGIDDPYQLKY